ncbi:MAG: uracil-DNA glycosylase [Anaeromyxobacter sp.]
MAASPLRILREIERELVACRACPRLVRWREEVARVKRRAYREETYWGRPVPGFGDPAARVVLVGLAPGAHGANRTGRMFTGDGTGDFLYAALHRAGLASQASAVSRDDGLRVRGLWLTNAGRCVPPDNRPTPAELARCAPFLDRELAALSRTRVIVALGAIAWDACLGALARAGHPVPRPKPRFAHGAEVRLAPGAPLLLGTYHPSRQNTQTGRLVPAMLDAVIARAVSEAGLPPVRSS